MLHFSLPVYSPIFEFSENVSSIFLDKYSKSVNGVRCFKVALGFAFSFANDISMNSSNAVKLIIGGFFEFFTLSRVGSAGPVPEVDLNMWLPSQRILKANSIQFLSFGSFGIPAENVAPR